MSGRYLASLILASLISASPANLAVEPISRMQIGWWKQRFLSKQNELRDTQVNLVWIGDSITQDWERDGPAPWLRFKPVWDRYYGGLGSVNLGFKGDSTCHVLWRLLHGEMEAIRPKVAVLLIGANNFGRIHTPADQTFEGIDTILSLLHSKWPRARIIVIGVLPSIRSTWVNENTKLLNTKLSELAGRLSYVAFVDAQSVFIKNGRVDPSAFIDPKLSPPQPALHPTAEAQEEIAAMIAPLIRRDFIATGH